MEKQLLFVLGGARSGKSTFAQKFIEAQNCPALFVATAEARDDEMKARIAAHRASRSTNWLTLESPLNVAESIQNTAPTPWLMLDCLTLLVSNILLSCPEPTQETEFRQKLETEMENLLKTYHSYPGSWVIVSNEVGLGLVPPYASGVFIATDSAGQTSASLRKLTRSSSWLPVSRSSLNPLRHRFLPILFETHHPTFSEF